MGNKALTKVKKTGSIIGDVAQIIVIVTGYVAMMKGDERIKTAVSSIKAKRSGKK